MTIQSVLDVKDDSPPPRDMSSVFNRSILILTPQRALKFTAASAERHYLWLTALSFLAHSCQSIPENIGLVPPAAGRRRAAPEPGRSGSRFRRSSFRGSIWPSRGKASALKVGPLSAPPSRADEVMEMPLAEDESAVVSRGGVGSRSGETAAAPPSIPRLLERSKPMMTMHTRKRSNTGGQTAPPLTVRGRRGITSSGGYPYGTTSSSAHGMVGMTNWTEGYPAASSSKTTTMMTQVNRSASHRTRERSPPLSQPEAMGTVRMEAFISPLAFPRLDDHPDELDEFRERMRGRSTETRRKRRGSRGRYGEPHYGPRGGREDLLGRLDGENFFREDPFQGF